MMSAVIVPLMRGQEVLGVLIVRRASPEPYSPQQVALLETFATQAVIAMETARLFEETQQQGRELEERNRELTETLQQQTATAEEFVTGKGAEVSDVMM